MKRRYELPDVGKALRCVLSYLATVDDARLASLAAAGRATDTPARGREATDFRLRGEQAAWLRAAATRLGAPDTSAALRWLLDAVVASVDEATVFTVRRCATKLGGTAGAS